MGGVEAWLISLRSGRSDFEHCGSDVESVCFEELVSEQPLAVQGAGKMPPVRVGMLVSDVHTERFRCGLVVWEGVHFAFSQSVSHQHSREYDARYNYILLQTAARFPPHTEALLQHLKTKAVITPDD